MIKIKDLKIFAFIWSIIFMVLGFINNINLFFHITLLFLIIGTFKLMILSTFYKIWVKIGEFIRGILSKIIMIILYFVLFIPISICLKILGKDLLKKTINKSKKSYWIDREFQPQSMQNQF